MQTAAEKEGVLQENTGYDISFVEDYKFKCSIIPEAQKQEMLMRMMDTIYVNSGVDRDATKRDVGVAVGKIGDKTYVVVVETETPAAPDTTTKN